MCYALAKTKRLQLGYSVHHIDICKSGSLSCIKKRLIDVQLFCWKGYDA